MGVVNKEQPWLTNISRNLNNRKMKVLAVLLLASYAIAHGGDDYHMFKNWAQTKAMESCWGEENMKIYTVNMKKAVAKCHQVDAPELELPPLDQLTVWSTLWLPMQTTWSRISLRSSTG